MHQATSVSLVHSHHTALPSCLPQVGRLEDATINAAPEVLPLSPQDHRLFRLVLSSFCAQYRRCRGPACGAGCHCQLRGDPPLGQRIWGAFLPAVSAVIAIGSVKLWPWVPMATRLIFCVQMRRNAKAAKRFRKRLKKADRAARPLGRSPCPTVSTTGSRAAIDRHEGTRKSWAGSSQSGTQSVFLPPKTRSATFSKPAAIVSWPYLIDTREQ